MEMTVVRVRLSAFLIIYTTLKYVTYFKKLFPKTSNELYNLIPFLISQI